MIAAMGLALVACSSSSSSGGGGPPPVDGGATDDAGSATGPCGPGGVFGTFRIKGTLGGTESICGLSLGSFDGSTLTIAQGTGGGASVTVTNSGSGHIDVSSCAGTVSGCNVTASCAGSTDKQASVSLTISVSGNTLSGSSQIRFNGCQAPGLSFTGTR